MEPSKTRGADFDLPDVLSPPCEIEPSTDVIGLWNGKTELRRSFATVSGDASIFIDILPRPRVRFSFESPPDDVVDSTFSQLRKWFERDNKQFEDGDLECGPLLGNLAVSPTGVKGGTLQGVVIGPSTPPKQEFTSAKLLVLNGPPCHGTGIRKGRGFYAGRLSSTFGNGGTVTVDGISLDKQPARSLYSFTHVAEIRFTEPRCVAEFDSAAELVFKTLSMMRGRWVGLIGNWYYVNDELCMVVPQVTKVSRQASGQNWFHDTFFDAFGELFSCFERAFQNEERGTALQTGLHWLIEAQLCAGGVEGSIVLIQAALEALAWFEIVQNRQLCSVSGFQDLPAADKMRWFASLFSIPTAVPAHYSELVDYLKEFSQLADFPGVLVDVRNALVHGTPKKVKRLFGRVRGEDERSRLWFLASGVLEQAVLAIAGYQGQILRRDVEAVWTDQAIRQVPWAKPHQNRPN